MMISNKILIHGKNCNAAASKFLSALKHVYSKRPDLNSERHLSYLTYKTNYCLKHSKNFMDHSKLSYSTENYQTVQEGK